MGRVRYTAQHNSKGKYHLIPEAGEGSRELCNSKGTFNYSYSYIEMEEGLFYEVNEFGENRRSADPIPLWMLNAHYCKRCIKKALSQNNCPVS